MISDMPEDNNEPEGSNQAADASQQSVTPKAEPPENDSSGDTSPTQLDGFTSFIFGLIKGLAAVGCLVPVGFVIALSAAFSRKSASLGGMFFFGLVIAVCFVLLVTGGRPYQRAGGLMVVAATAIFLLLIVK